MGIDGGDRWVDVGWVRGLCMEESDVVEPCPKCGATLEKVSWEVGDETVFVDDCPNCSYRYEF